MGMSTDTPGGILDILLAAPSTRGLLASLTYIYTSLEQTINADRTNGTSFYTQTLNLTLTKLDAATQAELIDVVRARPHVFIEDYNGNYFLIGAVHGAEATGGTIVTGAAMGDLSGFTLTMTAEETLPAYFVTSTVVTGNESATQITP